MYQISRWCHSNHIKSHLNLPVQIHGNHKSWEMLRYQRHCPGSVNPFLPSPLSVPPPNPSTSLASSLTVKFHPRKAPLCSGSEPFPGPLARNGMWSREQPRQVPTGTRGRDIPSLLTVFTCALPRERSLGHRLLLSQACAGTALIPPFSWVGAMGIAWSPPQWIDSTRALWVVPAGRLGSWRQSSVTTPGWQPENCDGRGSTLCPQAWRVDVFQASSSRQQPMRPGRGSNVRRSNRKRLRTMMFKVRQEQRLIQNWILPSWHKDGYSGTLLGYLSSSCFHPSSGFLIEERWHRLPKVASQL